MPPHGDSQGTTHRLGRLALALSGWDPILPYLRSELEPLRAEDDSAAHVAFDFGPDLPPLTDTVVLSPLRVGADAYIASYGGLRYHVSGTPSRLRVRVHSESSFAGERFGPRSLLRAADRSYLLPSEKVAKNFMYNVFDYLTQLANVEVGQTYLHASSFEKDGQGVAMAAWGGVGKTTAMLKLVSEQGWRFLSDDLGLVDEQGTLWRTPKRMQVYVYNLAGQKRLYRTLASGRSAIDRAAWHFGRLTRGPERTRRRVSAEDLFGPERVARSAKLTRLFAMERADVGRVTVASLGAPEAARRMTATVVREVHPLGDLISAMYSGAHHPVLPTHQSFMERTSDALMRALDGVTVALLRVPLRANPDDLAEFLVRELERG